MKIVRALPHGHVAAALGMARQIGLDELLPDGPERQRNLALALIVERVIDPAAKLATARALDERTAINSLGTTLGLGNQITKLKARFGLKRVVMVGDRGMITDARITADTVRAYKSLARVERAFRCLKTTDLDIRPIYHWVSPRVRAHLFLCMLAYYLEWHMRQALAPILFDDHDRAAGEALRSSPAAKRKARKKRTDDGLPVHSFRTLLVDLATLTRNTVRYGNAPEMALLARPTEIQQRALKLLGVKLQV